LAMYILFVRPVFHWSGKRKSYRYH
jgi:hypothetical protein